MIRKARIADVRTIQSMILDYSRKGEMLPRSLSSIYENLRDYFVYENENGELVGSAAIHIMWEDLAEVRSLAVRESEMGKGIGTKLVEACMSEAIVLGIARVFALTYRPGFFKRLGFREIDKSELPQKIWSDCLKCVKFPDCDEVALVADFSGNARV
ncbi:MAG: N-acetyltransferase [Syntrophorhabdaceae bacterium]|nr:N-acetyltransferase [Syntrophorhabdaceae bacterium]